MQVLGTVMDREVAAVWHKANVDLWCGKRLMVTVERSALNQDMLAMVQNNISALLASTTDKALRWDAQNCVQQARAAGPFISAGTKATRRMRWLLMLSKQHHGPRGAMPDLQTD
jgi:hypothetical protein